MIKETKFLILVMRNYQLEFVILVVGIKKERVEKNAEDAEDGERLVKDK